MIQFDARDALTDVADVEITVSVSDLIASGQEGKQEIVDANAAGLHGGAELVGGHRGRRQRGFLR
jgi:hypothetical protein